MNLGDCINADTLAVIGSAIAIVGVNLTVFSWLRSDIRSIESDLKKFQREIRADRRRFEMAMQREARDFHGRLCSIEEKNKKS